MRRLLVASLCCALVAHAYPLDAYKRTGIRRLEGYRLAQDGKVRSAIRVPAGGMLTEDKIHLRMTSAGKAFQLTPSLAPNPQLQKGLAAIFAQRHSSYGIAILDITNPDQPRYAALRPDLKLLPGSVGKLLVAAGFLNAVARVYPRIEDRERFLRDTVRAADEFIVSDGKTVPLFNPGDAAVVSRPLRIGDRFNLWEWLDHMTSQSSNAAGSFVWKETVLLRHFGKAYPPSAADEKKFFAETPKAELGRLSVDALDEASRAAGIDTGSLRLGTMFTRRASAIVPGTSSYGTPFELLRWFLKMEQGAIVDQWTSLELKKLIYFARPRYRYASSPALTNAAVYFKSGSFFQCAPEPGFKCGQYRGNATNIMNSVAIVESGRKVYLVAMMSNVLKLNSAGEHMAIATQVERLLQMLP